MSDVEKFKRSILTNKLKRFSHKKNTSHEVIRILKKLI